MNDKYLVRAIKSLRVGSEFTISDGDYSTIKWDVLEGNAPTVAEIDAEIEKIKADEAAAMVKAENDKAALLAKLGITADEAKLLLS
jgi:hypothetical protein